MIIGTYAENIRLILPLVFNFRLADIALSVLPAT